MPKYKYNVYKASKPPSENQLNELADHGWRFVTIVRHGGKYLVYFESDEDGAGQDNIQEEVT